MENQDKEMMEAIFAAEEALVHLKKAKKYLDKAKNWGIFDILGGGLFVSLIKHSRMDEANEEIQQAKLAIENLHRELQDVQDYINVDLNLEPFLAVTDYLFDNMFSDLLVQSKINEQRQQVNQTIFETEKILQTLRSAV